jgi:hypothetical protein
VTLFDIRSTVLRLTFSFLEQEYTHTDVSRVESETNCWKNLKLTYPATCWYFSRTTHTHPLFCSVPLYMYTVSLLFCKSYITGCYKFTAALRAIYFKQTAYVRGSQTVGSAPRDAFGLWGGGRVFYIRNIFVLNEI